jgi:hypothetical protein
VVDANSGTAAVGQRVIGAGITEIVKIKTVTSQTALILDKPITVADDVVLALSPYASVEAGDTQYEVTGISGEVLSIRLKDDPDSGGLQTIIPDNSYITRRWRWSDLFDSAPRQSEFNRVNGRGTGDEVHIVIFDTTGDITGKIGGASQECVAQGIANTVTGFFSGMGGCAMIGQSIINIKSGGRLQDLKWDIDHGWAEVYDA